MMDGNEVSSEQALQYIGELIAEYMKTLPPPVRGPVLQAANNCLAEIGKVIRLVEKKASKKK